MKPMSAALLAILASRSFYVADLYEFSGGNLGSNVLRYCAGDQSITHNGILYSAGGQVGPFFDRQDTKAKIHLKMGVEVDTLVFDVIPGSAMVAGVTFRQACLGGFFDGADCVLRRVYMPTYGDTRAGALIMFRGRVGSISFGRSVATFSVNTHLELLNQQLPRNLFQAPCVNQFGGVSCGVNAVALGVNDTVVSGGPGSTIISLVVNPIGNLFASNSNYFDQGKVTLTSGVNAGQSRSVKSWSPNWLTGLAYDTITLSSPLFKTPLVGDALTVFPGCDRTQGANGCAKFANLARFRAEPYTPTAETAV